MLSARTTDQAAQAPLHEERVSETLRKSLANIWTFTEKPHLLPGAHAAGQPPGERAAERMDGTLVHGRARVAQRLRFSASRRQQI